MGRKQPGQNDPAAGREEGREANREPLQRLKQDVGENKRVGPPVREPAGGEPACRESGRLRDFDERSCAVAPGVFPGDPHGRGIDVAAERADACSFRRRDRQHARARADVERGGPMRATAPGASPCGTAFPSRAALLHFEQTVERQQAAAGGPMMPGAERERRLDFNGDAIDRDAVPIVGTLIDLPIS